MKRNSIKKMAGLLVYTLIFALISISPVNITASSGLIDEWYGYQANGNNNYNQGLSKFTPETSSGYAIWGCNSNLTAGTYKVTFIMKVNKSAIAPGKTTSQQMMRFNIYVGGISELFPRDDISVNSFLLNDTYKAFSANFTISSSDIKSGNSVNAEIRLWSNAVAQFSVYKIIVSDVDYNVNEHVPVNSQVYTDTKASAVSGNGSINNGDIKLVNVGTSGHVIWGWNVNLKPGTYKLTFIISVDKSTIASGKNEFTQMGRFNPSINGRDLYPMDFTPSLFNNSNTYQAVSANMTVLSSDIPAGQTTTPTEVKLWSEGIITFRISKIIISDINFDPDTYTDTNLALSYNSINASTQNLPNYAKENIVGSGEWVSTEQNPWIQMNWASPVTLNSVVISDRTDSTNNVNSGILHFSDGSSIGINNIPIDGRRMQVNFQPKSGITWVKFQTFGGTGSNVGLTEFEVYDLSGNILNQPVSIPKNNNSDTEGKIAPKSNYMATTIYAVNTNGYTKQEMALLSTLAGLAAKSSYNQIYISPNPKSDYHLNIIKSNYNVDITYIDDLYKLVNIYKNYINGYILYNIEDSSFNAATSLAGPFKGIIVDVSIEAAINSTGITDRIMDVRGKNEQWVFNNYWSLFRHDMVVEQRISYYDQLRDYATSLNAFVFTDTGNGSFRNQVFSALNNNARVFGWFAGDEFQNISAATAKGLTYVASDYNSNLSTLSGFDSNLITQNSRTPAQTETNVHYVTIIISDGDNEQFMAGGFSTDPGFYGSQHRGQFNMGWPIPAAMYDNTPTILKNLYDTATNKDQFMLALSGTGYMYPSYFPTNMIDAEIDAVNEIMGKTDTRVMSVFDEKMLDNTAIWDKYTSKPNIDGIFYGDYSLQNLSKGRIVWSNGKPVISFRNLLWAGLEEEAAVIQSINSRSTDIHNPDAYTTLYVHAWTKNMDNINTVINGLNSNVRVVSPEQFVDLVTMNLGPQGTMTFEAEGPSFGHNTGRAEPDGWSARTSDNAGHMLYGPYTTAIPGGQNMAAFRMMIDNNSTNNDVVVSIDVFDSTTGNILAFKAITRREFSNTNTYQDFILNFTNQTGNSLEFRVYYHAKAYIKVDKVVITY